MPNIFLPISVFKKNCKRLLLNENRKVLKEKERKDSPIINGGFMVIESEIFNYLTEEMEHLEKDVLVPLSENGKLMAFYHDGFWQCMDTLQEKKYLCALWETRKAPWVNKKKD